MESQERRSSRDCSDSGVVFVLFHVTGFFVLAFVDLLGDFVFFSFVGDETGIGWGDMGRAEREWNWIE